MWMYAGLFFFVTILLFLFAAAALLMATRNGTSLPLTNGLTMRRWVEPHGKIAETIIAEIQAISMNSVGSLFTHTMLHGDVEALRRRIIMIIYKQGKPVMFHAILKVKKLSDHKTPIFHVGLVMVISAMKRKGLQKITALNLWLLSLDYFTTTFIATDVGASPSGYRLLCHILEDPYPDYRNPEARPSEEHVLIANHVINCHKPDMGMSSLATFNQDTFVVKDSSKREGGGSYQCAHTLRDGESSNIAVNAFFIERIGGRPFDEVFFVGRVHFLRVLVKMACMLLQKGKL